ncbi:YciI family protein [Pseudokineococcus basanitobsidens]|uniref:YciI family protein n=1 Tax=Pseudokineococcus basanitobsidens TaxID=1926649 RepID=A0ABU8RKV4_9ACTN
MTHVVAEIRYRAPAEEVAAVRPEHRRHLQDQHARGLLVLSGPWADGTGACLVYRVEEEGTPAQERVRALLETDPFRREGLVDVVSVRAWTVVVGA